MHEISLCDSLPGDVHVHNSPTFGDSITLSSTPNFQGHESGNGKASTASKSSLTRKGLAAKKVANDGPLSSNSMPVSENENPAQKRKRTKKALDELTEEQTKKRIPHSTRRNKRRVEKSLLETLEDEIDPQKVRLKDLIRLTEFRERLAIKEATKLRASTSNRGTCDEFQKDPSHNDEDFGFEHSKSSGEEQAVYGDSVSSSSSSFNYQSFMNKECPSKWVKEDTEHFYEAIEQFGFDFNMIAQLFSGRSHHQIKLKFQKEDRQNRLRITEAFHCHPKDNSKYILVINELQKVAAQKKEFDADESNDLEDSEPTPDNDWRNLSWIKKMI